MTLCILFSFQLRTHGGGGELYAAPPDIIQHRGKFMDQQKQTEETDGHHTYATVGKKRLSSSGDADEGRPNPPYTGKPAPPYPGKVRARGHSSSSELPPYSGTPRTTNARIMSGSSTGDGGSDDSIAKPPIDSPTLEVVDYLIFLQT